MQQTKNSTANSGSHENDARLREGRNWAAHQLNWPQHSVTVIAADASFRRYFRLQHEKQSLVLMDAPPQLENSRPFVEINQRLRDAGLHAPAILHADLDAGFLLLEDLGDTLYRELINESSAAGLFPEIFAVLKVMAESVPSTGLPHYSTTLLQQELDLFTGWYLHKHRKTQLSPAELESWHTLCAVLVANAAEQPQVFVHKDFHSSNLLRTDKNGPAIIDFQDAVRGPLCYDISSLLWDRYITWPRPQLTDWMSEFLDRLDTEISHQQWLRWCDLTGLQRNLKIVGIFARLHYRDDRRGYLELIPRFYGYVLDALAAYPEFADMHSILEDPRCAP
jgi:aminoglycoside/choline kinase family phosphotransferase